MAVEDALVALGEHWDDVASQLDTAQMAEVRVLISRLGGAGYDRAVTRIADILVVGLPATHPVRRALAGGYLFEAAPAFDRIVVTADLQHLADVFLSPSEAGEADGDAPPVAHIVRVVTDRLLAAPALTEQEVRARGADPADPGLIRLGRPAGGWQWPEFQFAAGAGPLPVVRTINSLLGAAADPLGVAGWWLCVNGWLGRPPSQLIGQVADQLLVSAARAVSSEP